jgi:hypothetical protein
VTSIKRVVLAEDRHGSAVVAGPVYTDKGIAELRTLIEAQPGWTVTGEARLVSKAQLEWRRTS